ncbi:phosphoglycerate dehydrogenase [Thermodesulfobacteriota bacterium]
MTQYKWKVLVTAPYFQGVYGRYAHRMEQMGLEVVLPRVKERLSEAELLPIIADFDGVISGDDEFTETVFRAAKNLKVISKWGTGIDSIDSEAASRLGIAIRNTPGAFSEPVADTVFAYILAFFRGVHKQDLEMREGVWNKRTCFALKDLTLGIVGVGNCGKAVARRAVGFGLRILGNDIVKVEGSFVDETGIEMTQLDELLEQSDIVSMNCDLNSTSYRLMTGERFAKTKVGCYYISTCRGPVTDEKALIEALRSGHLAGAGLDVFEEEPLPLDSPLRGMDNVLLSPHNANSDPATAERIHESTLRHLTEELERGDLL